MLKYLFFIINILSVICNTLNNVKLPDTDREFCIYTKNNVYKMVNPFYINSQNETVYFDNIENYAKYIGPEWVGVGVCGEDKIVNNMGEYFTVFKSDKLDKRSDDNETKLDSDNNNNDDIKSDSTTANDKVDEKLIDKENEAYNPYHPLLIHAENSMGPNVITILGAPYKEKKLNNFELQNDEDNDFRDCNISVNNMDKSSMTCAVAYTHNIQNTITISSSKGTAYHQGFGYSYGEGDAITDEIGSSLELARALARGSSVSYSKSEGGSVALENVHTVVNTESSSNTNSYDYTHTTTHDESYTFTVSEENSHSRSDGGEIVDESNWSSYM
ncbi:hypothetical protein BCR36DRAFT_362129 [Piromyces finnis]|uniref:Uncharacterized protein n=1 Tax=Piromyces finnis TaxID=1754191 RepID=A0A1Y1UX06_9FUNG|nr:hypothetical protein BCR36DRAFT_362129 [Piromyces finnis]|eukprot:ORX42640.1 hypothetical protein BCR36DRAFT_362129 [Piromyces finnis]